VRLAYLILAHHQPALLARLVDRMLERDTHVFLHVDARTDLQPFLEQLSACSNPWVRTNLHLATRRRKVGYMAFSTVEATLALMRQASEYAQFGYYTLLSGADYPIKSRGCIREVFAGTDKQLIVYWKLEDRPKWLHKIQYLYLTDLIPVRSRHRPDLRDPRSLYRSFPHLYWRGFRRVQPWIPRRSFPFQDLVPYGGSQWWSLTEDAVRYVLRFADERPEVSRFYRYTHCPDEMYFQTVLLNSPLSETAVNRERYLAWSAETPPEQKATGAHMIPEGTFNLRYIEWVDPASRAPRGYPSVLDETDFDRLMASECLFARKVDEERSAVLLDRLDQALAA
jgi:hypothetical protein